MALRVMEWSTGTVGRHAIAGIEARPELELVGVWVSDPEKVGRDAGELAGLGRELGVRATDDRDAVRELRPDCIVHTAMTDNRIFEAVQDLVFFLENGINVVSSGPVLLQYPWGVLPEDEVERIHLAGVRGGASLHVNGIDPGFANDVLPLVLTSLSQRIDQVRCMEIADYGTYGQAMTMTELFGFGRPLDETPFLLQPGVLALGWGSVVRQIAVGLGLTLDEPLVERHERLPAEEDVDTVCCRIAEGTAAALRFEVIGTVGGVEKVVLEHVTRTRPDQAPQWPRPARGDGCYRVEITGEPSMTVEFEHRGEHGDHNDSGMIMTAMRLVNAVEAVVEAKPGIVTALDLPLVTGRGLAG